MDRDTLDAYDRDAAAFAEDWETQPPPSDMQALILEHFTTGPTADIGCGSGRDAAWMDTHGFATIGYDASEGLLVEARRRHPGISFKLTFLPKLDGVEAARFQNVLCETVIMHLPSRDVGPSVTRLIEILRPGGVLFLSWRLAQAGDSRDGYGRLYGDVDSDAVMRALRQTDILLDQTTVNASSGKAVRRIITRRRD